MKVLLIDVNCKNSSTGKIVYDLYKGIREKGDAVAICYGRGPVIKGENIYKFGLDWETYLHAFLTRLTGFTGCFSFFSTRRLIKYIRTFKPDIVHIHELHAYFVNLKPLLIYLKQNTQIRVVLTLHCEFDYTGKCGHSIECEQWKTECGKCPHVRAYPTSCFFDHTKYMFNQKKKWFSGFGKRLIVVTPSRWLAERAKQSFLGAYDIKVIHNGIDTSVFYPRNTERIRIQYGIKHTEKVILALAPGLMNKSKGGAFILLLAQQLKDRPIKFLMVGVDEDDLQHGENVIVIHRTQNQEELAEIYSLADVFVICSKRENYPTTCIEAQACGTPVCGFDVGGIKETVHNMKNDSFFPYGDTDALGAYIEKTLQEPKTIDNTIVPFVSKNTMIHLYYNLFKEMIKNEYAMLEKE